MSSPDSSKAAPQTARQQVDRSKIIAQSDKSNTLGYAIAVLMIGTALGNMFLAGGIKNMMKIRFPSEVFKSQAKQNSNSSRSQQRQYNYSQRSYYYQQTKRTPLDNDFIPEGL